jgi:YHS domain-containing protein
VTFTYKGQVIAFCCDDCKEKFQKDPAKYIAKVPGFKDPDKK